VELAARAFWRRRSRWILMVFEAFFDRFLEINPVFVFFQQLVGSARVSSKAVEAASISGSIGEQL